MAKKTTLKAKQERFCQQYIKNGDGTKAAISAGYSAKSAKQIASRMLTFANVKARLAELMAKTESKAVMDATEALEELSLIARVDMATFIQVNPNGSIFIRPLDTLPVGASRCIKKIKQKVVRKTDPLDREGAPLEECTLEFELCDKVKALEKIGQHHDLFLPDPEADEDEGDVKINITYVRAKKPEAKKS